MNKTSDNKTILVTGGAGFLGSHLCDSLISSRNRVLCLDNFHTGDKKNITHLLDKNFQLIEHDVINKININENIDQIYNLACPASPVHYQSNPIQTLNTNILGVTNVLDLAVSKGASIFQASTSEVYGDPLIHPQTEIYWGNVNPVGIRSCYDEGKRCAETLIYEYYRHYQIDINIVRIFNTYGPRMNPEDGRVVSNFIVQALRGEDITIYGDGLQTRSFCYADDLVAGFIKMMNSDNFQGPVNLGNPGEFTMLELAEKIINIVGGNSQLVFMPLPKDDPRQRKPDISLAKKELDWEPKVDLEAGLIKTIDYFKNLLSI
jgi:UDP-glucuronate decarboxylase